MAVKDNPNFNNNPRTLNVIREYKNWKKLVVEYNRQQYRIIKNKLMNIHSSHQNDDELSDLRSNVEQDHLLESTLSPKTEKLAFLKKRIERIKKENPELLDLESIFDESNCDKKNIEAVERVNEKLM